jgi:hypothetical protein
MGDKGMCSVGMLFVVKRRGRCPRASLEPEAEAMWVPTLRNGLARAANDDDSSRGDLTAPRSPMLAEKAILLQIHCTPLVSANFDLCDRGCGVVVDGEGDMGRVEKGAVGGHEGSRERALDTYTV